MIAGLTPDERGDYTIDDMVLTEDQTLSYFGLNGKRSGIRGRSGIRDRSGIPSRSSRWKMEYGIHTLPYQFDDNFPFSDKEKNAIRQMIGKFNSEFELCLSIRYT